MTSGSVWACLHCHQRYLRLNLRYLHLNLHARKQLPSRHRVPRLRHQQQRFQRSLLRGRSCVWRFRPPFFPSRSRTLLQRPSPLCVPRASKKSEACQIRAFCLCVRARGSTYSTRLGCRSARSTTMPWVWQWPGSKTRAFQTTRQQRISVSARRHWPRPFWQQVTRASVQSCLPKRQGHGRHERSETAAGALYERDRRFAHE